MRAEDAQKTLKELQIKWKDGYKDRAAKAPETARTFALGLHELDTLSSYHQPEKHQNLQKQLQQTLQNMVEAERLQVFQVLFPRFAAQVEATWQLLDTLPYQLGYSRKSFRVTNHIIQFQKKWQWMLDLWQLTRHYDQDLSWMVAWAGHLSSYHGDTLGYLLAAAINQGDQEVLQILKDTAASEHEVGLMGRHVTRALLSSNNPEAWIFTEKLLLAAQKQEGLRQVVLETVDEAHPEAFLRMVKLILAEDLLRFSAVMRAVAVWLGLHGDVTERKMLETQLSTFLNLLEDPEALQNALQKGNGQQLYMALMVVGFRDAREVLRLGQDLLQDPDVERRYAAAQVMQSTGLPEFAEHLLTLMRDSDLRVASLGISQQFARQETPEALFMELVNLGEKLPKEGKLEPLVWPWLGWISPRSAVFNLLPQALGQRPKSDLLPYFASMGSWQHGQVLRDLGKSRLQAGPLREHLVQSLGHTDEHIRRCAFEALEKQSLFEEEIQSLENLFSRKGADVRQKASQLLLKQPTSGQVASVRRLTTQKKTDVRLAGLDLLGQMVKEKSSEPEVQGVLGEVLETFAPKNANEAQLYEGLRLPDEQLTLQNGLGLFDPQQLSRFTLPQFVQRNYQRLEMVQWLKELDRLIFSHADTEIHLKIHNGEMQTFLLGNLIEHPHSYRLDQQETFPLAEVWQKWWAARPDPQPHDLEQLKWIQEVKTRQRFGEEARHVLLPDLKLPALKSQNLILEILEFLKGETLPAEAVDFLLDLQESELSLLDPLLVPKKETYGGLQDPRPYSRELYLLHQNPTPDQVKRLWNLELYSNRGFAHLPKLRPELPLVLKAWEHGFASEHDVLDHLIGPREDNNQYGWNPGFRDLAALTARNFKDQPAPELLELVERIRSRILQIELHRADLPTAASLPASQLRSVQGMDLTLKLLKGLGKETMTRGHVQNTESKTAVYSHLIRVSFPAPQDTPEGFSALAKEQGLSDSRLLELAVYAPQWADLVEKHLGWTGLTAAIYWLHAHTRDTGYFVDQQVREVWEAEIAERTPLSAQDLLDGAVDVQWFKAMIAALGENHFAELLKASRYLSSTGAQKRAELYARAILGQADEREMVQSIKTKRHQDSVRALGLLPAQQEGVVLQRYRILQAFLKESKQFGAMKQASEQLASRIGLHNLARSAGFADPERLMWQMETLEVQNLNGQQVTLDTVTLTLRVDEEGTPHIDIQKAGKPLKNIPPALRKNPEVVELLQSKQHLEQQKSRMREAFEQAMVRGDHFSLKEVQTLFTHPVVRPMLQNLLWVQGEQKLGFSDGSVLNTLDGSSPLTDEGYRIAHAHDLLTSGQWREWQQHCFEKQIQQPFKQIFREYYLPTAQELEGTSSKRYEGQQLNPRQALALLKTRNWVTVPEEGARKTFHSEGLNVWLYFQEGFYTPLDIEGLTVSQVVFTERGKWEPLPISSVPPRIFSEVMRDVDLIVSVAHVGGVDPEASQSTVEMRSRLIQETLRLLKIDNVQLKAVHALIQGHHADYSVHLGSGTVHRHPGGALCILPVHSQHRGRIFLPFADNDPKTAEVISKVLLLAKDRQIQDPSILEQLT
ncbi:DUF5724 domain-containing protein [Deinococcus roseus]|uniref:DUF4132 domain-containing protein n=1 Tax=Deinococcus roseus TaxID=392414 RepID=A0ABQ2D571_9DEIO|nr:DUF5724 domain-containing protein [Deinococcus roseus]GGJ43274.1 hypothetical protein GCM10008938_31910 [Deinococcus roseus]